MATDLHTACLAEIDRQQAVTEAIARTGMLDPADRLRRLTHYRRILARHSDGEASQTGLSATQAHETTPDDTPATPTPRSAS